VLCGRHSCLTTYPTLNFGEPFKRLRTKAKRLISLRSGLLLAAGGSWRRITRDEQRKMIEYHHLTANLLIFHNVVTMTRALQSLIAEGHQIDQEALACFSPYQTEHLNRFGRYALKRDRVPEPLDRVRVLRLPPPSEGLPTAKIKKSVTI
jgi:hypothetical protein